MTPSHVDVPLEQLLAELGLPGELHAEARRLLEAEGITNPRKQRISVSKAARVTECVDRHWQRLCRNCSSHAVADGRAVATVAASACTLCGGSNNARAVRELTEACLRAGVSRLLVVGGSPDIRRELGGMAGGSLELRLVDGTRGANKKAAEHDIVWADLVVVLGATELAHKVSILYTRHPDARTKLVTTSRRGIEAICQEIVRSDVVTGRRG